MRKQDERTTKAIKKAMETMDYVLETYSAPDFIEVIGRMGGDVVTMLYYDNGMVTEQYNWMITER